MLQVQFIMHNAQCTIHNAQFIIHNLSTPFIVPIHRTYLSTPFIIHYSLFIIHHSSFIIHHFQHLRENQTTHIPTQIAPEFSILGAILHNPLIYKIFHHSSPIIHRQSFIADHSSPIIHRQSFIVTSHKNPRAHYVHPGLTQVGLSALFGRGVKYLRL